MDKEILLTEQDARLIKAYLDDKEKVKAFIATYMYILSSGMGDGITESMILESEDLSEYQLDEGLIGNVMNFLKGKNAISKYYKGLDSAAKNYIAGAKKIDKMDKDKRSQYRKSELDKYEKSVSALDDIKKNIDELKADSRILQKYDKYAENKYKIKMFLTGRKADVSLSKMKGYEDDIDKIKADQTSLEDDIKKAEKEAEEAKAAEEEKEKGDDKPKKDEKPEETTDETPEEKPEVDPKKEAQKNKLKKDISKAKFRISQKEDEHKKAMNDGNASLAQNILKSKGQLQKNIEKMEAELEKLGENEIVPLRLFSLMNTINEQVTCLENLIAESL